MRSPWWRRVGPVVGAALLVALVMRLGTGPVGEGLLALGPPLLGTALVLTVLTTVCSALRWQLVARYVGGGLTLGTAVAACYQSQLINLTLPGGVIGDVDRGLRQGRRVASVRGGLGAVLLERTAGQVVLVAVTVLALLVATPFALGGTTAGASAGGVTAAAGATPVAPGALVRGAALLGGAALVIGSVLLARRVGWAFVAGVGLTSLGAVAGHVATLVVAARTVGVTLPLGRLVPLALVVLLVAGLPLNLAGWGPREGAAAWAFAAAGSSASEGLAVAVAYGAAVTVAALPGVVGLLRRTRPRPARSAAPGPAGAEVVVRG